MDENQTTIEQAVTMENGSPYAVEAPREPMFHKLSMFAMPCFVMVFYLVVMAFLIVLFYRLVRATEKIATKLENGITVKKEDSDTI